MSHLGERITDYLLDEMTEVEKAEANVHLQQCLECAQQVESFKGLYLRLQALPSVEPPRRLVFENGKKVSRPPLWWWLSPAVSAVAASILTVMLLTPSAPPATGPAPQLAAELDKRARDNDEEIQRLRIELALLESRQLAAKRETYDTVRSIQLLAQRIPEKGE